MPIFEFKCNSCGKSFEKIVFKVLEQERIICPNCGSESCQKLISAPGSVGVGSSDKSSTVNACSTGCCGCPGSFDN